MGFCVLLGKVGLAIVGPKKWHFLIQHLCLVHMHIDEGCDSPTQGFSLFFFELRGDAQPEKGV